MSTKENKYRFKPGDLVKYNKPHSLLDGKVALVLKQRQRPDAATLLFYQVKWCHTGQTTVVLENNVEAAY